MMLMFTSGTTGRSKGVMLSEKNYFSAMRMYVAGQAAVMRKAQELAPKDMDKPSATSRWCPCSTCPASSATSPTASMAGP